MFKTLVMTLTGSVGVLAGAVTLAAPAQDRPGVMTQARVFIENRSPAEAIPVTVVAATDLDRPLSVRVTETSAVLSAQLVRQAWEDDSITVRGTDFAGALAKSGAQGWEAVTVHPVPAEAGAQVPVVSVLLKRPAQGR